MAKIFIIAFALLILQGILSYSQIKNFQTRIKALKAKGLVGIGKEKGILKAGNITILVCNKQGKIITGEKMEGITIFTRFREIDNIAGFSIQQLKEAYANRKKSAERNAILQAIESLEKTMMSS
jgi:glucitol operon activator protein